MQAKLPGATLLQAFFFAFFLFLTVVCHAQISGISSISVSENAGKQQLKRMISFANYGESPRSEIYLGPSFLLHNGSSVGFSAAYTRYFQDNFGATAELSYYSGKTDQIKRTQVVAMGGITYYIQMPALPELSMSPYVMIGLSPSTSKSLRTESNGAVTKGTAFVAAVGSSFAYEVTPSIAASLRVDLNPTIINGFTNNNLRIGAGIVLRSF